MQPLTVLIGLLALVLVEQVVQYISFDPLKLAGHTDVRRRHRIARELLCGASHFHCPNDTTCALCLSEMDCLLATPLDRMHGMYRCYSRRDKGWLMPVALDRPTKRMIGNDGEPWRIAQPELVTLENIDTLY